MKHIFNCRRSTLAFYAISILGAVMAYKGTDYSMAIASIVGLIGASNSYQKAQEAKYKQEKN